MKYQHFEGIDLGHNPHPVFGLARTRLIERLDGLHFDPKTILDVGSGTGEGAQALHERFGQAQVFALDITKRQSQATAKRRGWWRRKFEVIQGDVMNPPVAPHSMDLIVSNLTLMFVEDFSQTLRSLRRLLTPQGLLLISMLGPDSLKPATPTSTPYMDVQTLAQALMQTGFHEPVLDTDWVNLDYADPTQLALDLEQLGSAGQLPSLVSPTRGAIKTQWEVVYASVWLPPAGHGRMETDGMVAEVPVDQITRRRR